MKVGFVFANALNEAVIDNYFAFLFFRTNRQNTRGDDGT